jgi:large subunit ribosomal protein L28
MSKVCDICDKKPMFGNSVARLGKGAMIRRVKARTSRRFNPNIQPIRAMIKGTPTKLKVCTSCIKAGKVQRVVG